jgi:hypothetical protein
MEISTDKGVYKVCYNRCIIYDAPIVTHLVNEAYMAGLLHLDTYIRTRNISEFLDKEHIWYQSQLMRHNNDDTVSSLGYIKEVKELWKN